MFRGLTIRMVCTSLIRSACDRRVLSKIFDMCLIQQAINTSHDNMYSYKAIVRLSSNFL